ncbi:MAG: hypothetical protein J6T38_07920 [Bacteroidaceae bacterium]|nr:hypothetical protein [Bacteroidaceae bacterium]
MTMRFFKFICIGAFALSCVTASAKEVKDTLYSNSGDRIILTYNVTHSGNQMSVRFTGAQKKLGQSNQKKYKKLDEVAVVFFDRNGNYPDMKFDGMETRAFMVPANVTYSRSGDGYFLINDNPSLLFTVAQNEDAVLNLPIYLASYEGKRHYKVFTQCGTLALSSKQTKKSGGSQGGGSRSNGGGSGDIHAANADNIQIEGITSEELVDEGLSPSEEALIRINGVKSMLEEATEYPFDEELTHEVSMLRELRFKVTDDEDVSKQITEVLVLYDAKKKELAGAAKANQQAQAAQQAQEAQAAQARSDSISAAQIMQSEEDKKNMMWIGGGIGALVLLFIGGKQIMQMVNQNKLQKQQKAMMEKMMKITQQQTNSMTNIPGLNGMSGMPGANEEMLDFTNLGGAAAATPGVKDTQQAINNAKSTTQQVQQQTRTLSREAEAAKQKLISLRAAKQGKADSTMEQSTSLQEVTGTSHPQVAAKPQAHTSLNDAIPAKYKRLAPKRKDTPNT